MMEIPAKMPATEERGTRAAAREASCRVLSFRRRVGETSFQVRGRSAVSLVHVLDGVEDGAGEAAQTASDDALEAPEQVCGLLRFYEGVKTLREAEAPAQAQKALELFEEARSLDVSSRLFRRFASLAEVAPQLWQAALPRESDGAARKPHTLARCVEAVQASIHQPRVAGVLHQAILDALAVEARGARRAERKPRLLAIWGSNMLDSVLTPDLMQACDGVLVIGASHQAAATQALVGRVLELQAQGPQAGSLRKPLFVEFSSLAEYLETSRIGDIYDVTLVTAGKIGGDGTAENPREAILGDLRHCFELADQVIFADFCAPGLSKPEPAQLAACRAIDAAEVVLRCRSGSDRYRGVGDDPIVVWAAQRLGLPRRASGDASPEAVAGLDLETWQALVLDAGFDAVRIVSSPTSPLHAFVIHASSSRRGADDEEEDEANSEESGAQGAKTPVQGLEQQDGAEAS